MTFALDPVSLQAQGLRLQPGRYNAYPDIQPLLNSIFKRLSESMNDVIPSTWYDDALATAYAANSNGATLELFPALGGAGTPNHGIPEWLFDGTDQNRWQNTWVQQQNAIQQYAAGKAEAGAAVLQQLRDNADYWNTIASKGGDISATLAGGISKATTILIVGGAIALLGLWFWKDPSGFKNFWGKLIPGKS